jgi:hypothetical protein
LLDDEKPMLVETTDSTNMDDSDPEDVMDHAQFLEALD